MKKFWVGGARVPHAPLRSATASTHWLNVLGFNLYIFNCPTVNFDVCALNILLPENVKLTEEFWAKLILASYMLPFWTVLITPAILKSNRYNFLIKPISNLLENKYVQEVALHIGETIRSKCQVLLPKFLFLWPKYVITCSSSTARYYSFGILYYKFQNLEYI